MAEPDFEARCEQCFGLCCVALSFDRGPQFGHDKLAGVPCHHLDDQFRCRIHARREDLGYDGCEAFDCLGAGQIASARFAGENWRRDPAMARRLYAEFSTLMRLQEMRQALVTASDLELAPDQHELRRALLGRFELVVDGPDRASAETVLTDARRFLRGLASELAAQV
ncbi:MAG: hypothetical protein KIT02_10535 [Devosia sp.]|uniref:hypothetical protein n=1 Tax=Devosia sp. TaxID=1871048 RepID=UPI0024CDDFB1|nr:hypothetical protein [Devosia sp.]UYN98399.1 MAG: hypothetical protein KIT02_10535 [Devosia sp.]